MSFPVGCWSVFFFPVTSLVWAPGEAASEGGSVPSAAAEKEAESGQACFLSAWYLNCFKM